MLINFILIFGGFIFGYFLRSIQLYIKITQILMYETSTEKAKQIVQESKKSLAGRITLINHVASNLIKMNMKKENK